MADTLNIQTRLNLIINKLQSGQSLSIDELAVEFDTSTRTIRRDFREKIPALIKGLTQDDSTKRWYIPHNQRSTLLSEEEELTLNLLMEESKKHGKDFYNQTIALLNKFKNSIDTSTIYSKVDAESIEDIKDDMVKVEKAILQNKLISCEYKNKKREVAPLKLASFDGFWYLVVKDIKKDAVVKYYFKDMSNIKILDDKYEYKCKKLQQKLDCAINAYFEGDKECFTVKLFVEKEVAKYFIRKPISNSQRVVKEYSDGSIDIDIRITHEMEILPTILSYIPYLKVVEPQYIWDIVLEKVKVLQD